MRKDAPSASAGARGSSSTVPPWSSTKRRVTARPRPVPLFLPCGDEGLEHGVADRGGHAGAFVGQGQHQPVPRIRRPPRRHRRRLVLDRGPGVQPPGALHGVARVGGDVEHRAAQLVDVQGRL